MRALVVLSKGIVLHDSNSRSQFVIWSLLILVPEFRDLKILLHLKARFLLLAIDSWREVRRLEAVIYAKPSLSGGFCGTENLHK